MLGPLDYIIWLSGFFLQAAVVVAILCRGALARYYAVAAFMATSILVNCFQYLCISRYGVDSKEYSYCYYSAESLRTILLFFVIIQLCEQIFAEMHVHRYIRGGASMLLFATALFSYVVIHTHGEHLTKHFVVEFGQNLYFVGVVITYALWVAILHFRETRARLIHLVLALGLYFSGTAATYALRNLFPEMQPFILQWVPPVFGALLPFAWSYTFWRVPEEARIMRYQLEGRTAR